MPSGSCHEVTRYLVDLVLSHHKLGHRQEQCCQAIINRQAVVLQLTGSRQSSDSCLAVVSQLLASHQPVISQLSGSHQAVVSQSSGRRQAVIT